MGRYEKHFSKMFLRVDEKPRPNRVGTWVFGQEYRFLQKYCTETPLLVEFLPLLPVTPNLKKQPKEASKDVFYTANVERDGHKGGGMVVMIRHDAEMLWFFLGTDSEHPKDLGGHIDFTVGIGEDAETFSFEEPVCIHVPRGLANTGMKITNQRRTIININVMTKPTKENCYIEHLYVPLPKEEGIELDERRPENFEYTSSDVECELG